MILAGADPARAMRLLQGAGAEFPLLIDPAGYKKLHRHPARPRSRCPARAGLTARRWPTSWTRSSRPGATAALSPTGYIPAGGTDVLQGRGPPVRPARPRPTRSSSRRWTSPCSAGPTSRRPRRSWPTCGRPVALVLGCQGDPLDQSKRHHPEPARPGRPRPADAHPHRLQRPGPGRARRRSPPRSAPAAASATPSTRPKGLPRVQPGTSRPACCGPSWCPASRAARSPSCSVPGRRLAPRCDCAACGGQRLTRFLRREHQDEAIAPRRRGLVAVGRRAAVGAAPCATGRSTGGTCARGAVAHHSCSWPSSSCWTA